MGVKTVLTLQEANQLFPSCNFVSITPTENGIIDTTYIVRNSSCEYILKKYERETGEKIQTEQALLKLLSAHNCNTPKYLKKNQEWHLYTKLSGEIPKNVQLYHIHALARFMAKLHNISKNFTNAAPFLASYEINKLLASVKKSHYAYYKKLSCLHTLDQKHDGFIHGDIFTDNTLFDKEKIAVFDFIDGGLGEFSFDTAIALLSFNPNNKRLHVNAFLRAYNQTSKKKISYDELQKQLKIAAKFYALLRISHDKKTRRAQELANFW